MNYHINNDIMALIPARGGSKGVPRKNIRQLSGFPLISYSIVAAKMVKKIDRVLVSTDDEEIADIAKQYGAEVPFLRPKEFATDMATDIEFVKHALLWLQENEGSVPAYLIHLRPTTPLRLPELIDKAIVDFISSEYTSLRSAHPAPESPYKWFGMKPDGCFGPLLNEEMGNDELNACRQNFPEAFIPDGYVDVLRTQHILDMDNLYGRRMKAFVSPICTEIDTLKEFEFLTYEIKKSGSILHDYLVREYGAKGDK